MEAKYGTPTNKAASGSAVATFTEAVDDSGGSTAFGVASGGPGVTATVDSTAVNMATPANAGLPCRPEAVAELPVLDVIGHRRGGGGGGIGGQPRGRGRGRRRGAFRNNYRGGFNQGRGGYDSTASSSYTLTQTRQAYGNRQTGWDSASQEVLHPLDTQQPQRGGRGRGGYGIGQQQNVVRRPSRGSGRSRASSSRSRRLEYDQPQQEAQNIVVLNEGGEQSARYPGHGAEEVEATMQGETTPPQQDDSRATVYLRDTSVASIESITLPTAVLEPHSLKSDDSTPSILTRVRPERRLSLVTETPAVL